MPTPRILYSEEAAKNLPSYVRTEETTNLLNNLKTLQTNKTPLLGLQEAVAYGRGWSLIRDKFNRDAVYKDSKTFAISPIPYKIHELRSDFSDTAKISTSRPVHPTVFGWDIGELENSLSDYSEIDDKAYIMNSFQPHLLISSIKQVYKLGGVNTICWHCSNPANGERFGGDKLKYISNNPISKILGIKNGTINDFQSKNTFKVFNNWLNYAIDFFKELVDENSKPIPIIFRPLHEGNINDFWWGGSNCTPADYIEFWQYIVDKFKDAKLYNVLFAYSVNDIYGENLMTIVTNKIDFETVFDTRYPAKTKTDYVDIIGIDFYRKEHNPTAQDAYTEKQNFYADCLKDLSAKYSKVAAVTETGIQSLQRVNITDSFIDTYEDFFIGKELAYVHFWRNDKDRNSIEFYSVFPDYYKKNINDTDEIRNLAIKSDGKLNKFFTNIKTKFLYNWLGKKLYGKILIIFLCMLFSLAAHSQMSFKDSCIYMRNYKMKPDRWLRFENFNIDSFLISLKIDSTITLKQLKSIKVKNGKYYFVNKNKENEEFANCNKIFPKYYSPFPNGEENPEYINYCISDNRGNLDAIVNYKKVHIVGDTCNYSLDCARILLPSYPDTVFQILIPMYNFTELNIAKLIFLLQEHEYSFKKSGYYHFIETYNEKDCNGKDKHPKMQKVLPKHKWPVKNSEDVFSAHTLKNNQLFVWDIWNPE